MYLIAEFIITYCMIPSVWFLGFIGCTLGLIVFSRDHMRKIGPITAYRLLFMSDIVNMIQMYDSFINQLTGISLNSLNDIGCKLLTYVNYFTLNLSPMLIIYISIEKLVAIKYPSKKYILRKKKYQLLYFFCILFSNMCIYLPSLFMYKSIEMVVYNDTNLTIYKSVCLYADSYSQQIISKIYLIDKVVIPFILMTLCSVLLIISVFKLRQRIIQNFLNNQQETNNYKKDIRVAVTSLLLNIIYLVLNAPIAIVLSLPFYDMIDYMVILLVIYIFYFSYSLNFYLILFSNTLTKKEFFKLFYCLKKF